MNLSDKRLPHGIHITETDSVSASGIVAIPHSDAPLSSPKPWGYLMLHNQKVEVFKRQMEAYNLAHPDDTIPCFVHYSYKYSPKSSGHGVKRKLLPSVSGLVFLQGDTNALQKFLKTHHPLYHLVKDCSTDRPASIADATMRPFMEVVATHPENVTFLRDPFVKFAKDHVRLRILTGLFKGLEGYIVRVNRDRQLVMEIGGYAVAIRGVHNEDFAVAE